MTSVDRIDTMRSTGASSILFAWELGANLGHLKPLMALARDLAAKGAKATFAVNDLANVRLAARPGEFTTLQAPLWPGHQHFGHRPSVASYADILSGIGFADPSKLSTMIAAWDGLLELIKPDLVVADHSPALLAALHGTNTPVISVGTPFTMPPLSLDRLPPLRADQAPSLPEARLLLSLKAALEERGMRAPARMVDLLRTNERLVFGLPELDPYRAYRDETILTPPEPLPPFVEAPVKPRLFVYAGSEVPYIETLVQALVEMDVEIVAYLRGDVGPLPHFLKHRGHKVYDTPPPLEEVLPTVSHVLSQGGAFTCQAALAAGRPHLIMPLHNETELNLSMCAALGTARRLTPVNNAKALRSRLNDFLVETAFLRQARHWAMVLRERQQKSGLEEANAAVSRQLALSGQIRNARLRSAAAAAQPA
ncbi:MAG: hypothetical protein K8S25_00650 [Alphaproteobacteria bacterium]|nr:hypothetical protein [Alphaproteobacteria bacterium]